MFAKGLRDVVTHCQCASCIAPWWRNRCSADEASLVDELGVSVAAENGDPQKRHGGHT